MKLNNKGFAISTIMYMILIMAVILITLTLTLLSSRKLILDKTKQVAIENIYDIKNSRLPDAYKEVEYIQSTGTEYIDTNFIPNQDTRVIIDYQYIEILNAFLIGARTNSTTNAYTINVGNSATTTVTSYGTTGNVIYGNPDTKRHLVDKNKNLFYVDGVLLLTQPKQTFTAPGSLEIFAAYNGGTKGYLPSKTRLYSLKIYDNEKLVRNFVPCYRIIDSVIGLYDLVEDKFYTNSGTGTFLKGNDI